MKKIIAIVLLLCMALIGTACMSEGVDYSKTIVFSTVGAEGTNTLNYLRELSKSLEEKNFSYDVKIFSSSQLGGDFDALAGLQSGTISATTLQPGSIVTFIPELAVFDYPFLFNDYSAEEIADALSGDFFQMMDKACQEKGFKLLGIAQDKTFRTMMSNKPVRSIEDFHGIKIRTMQNPFHIAFWNAMSSSPTSINYSELYLALQQGTVDAQENSYEQMFIGGLYERQKYLIHTDHVILVTLLLFSNSIYQSLSAEDQRILQDAAAEATRNNSQFIGENDRKCYQEILDYGAEEIYLSDDDWEQAKKLVKPVYDDINDSIGTKYYNCLMETLKKGTKED